MARGLSALGLNSVELNSVELNSVGLNSVGSNGLDSLGLNSTDLYNLKVADVIQTYDSGGQLPLPGVLIGNETANVSVAPDNDAHDLGLDLAANYNNGMGPQVDGDGTGVLIDIDTNGTEEYEGPVPLVAAVDDSDSNLGGDAEVGNNGQIADDGIIGIHLSGTDDHTVDGVPTTVDQTVGDPAGTGSVFDGGVADTGLVNFDDA